jgi:hypothetical protein
MKRTLAFAVLVALATRASAISIVYPTEASFLAVIDSGYFLNEFDNTIGDQGDSQSFSENGFGYIMTAPIYGLWGINGAMSTVDSGDALIISFASGNVTAVGGTFSLTDKGGDPLPLTDEDGNPVSRSVTVSLSDGTSESFAASSFRGFTSDGPSIKSLSFSSDDAIAFPTLDHFYVGRVPDGGTTLVLLGGALTGLGVLRRKFRG